VSEDFNIPMNDVFALNIRQFRESLHALALPAADQTQLFPSNVDVPYELASNFSNWWLWFSNASNNGLTESQSSALRRIDEFLNRISGPENEALWTDEALRDSPSWEEVRKLAATALRAFNWQTK
jgi:hypothetical protein